MAKHTIENPDMTGSKSADSQGRLYLGNEYAGEEVEYAIKIVEDED